ncbi:MAG TPA: TMEM175 family protein [Candidatus Binataceae bacterium]|nr:TMEM175 family protein [Candidatus Binataceae bacterium]
MTEQDSARGAAPMRALGTTRVATLADGIFAIALTLLVLDLHAQHAATQTQLLSQLRGLAPQFAAFVISFAVLGVFWYGHHMELHFIVRSDRVHLGITLAFLLTIACVPFSASLLGRNYQFPLAATIYGVNLCLAGMVRYAHWVYATAGYRLVDPSTDPEMIRYVRRIFLLVPMLYLVAAALAWLSTIVAFVCFALIPLLYVKPARPTRHLTSLRGISSSP